MRMSVTGWDASMMSAATTWPGWLKVIEIDPRGDPALVRGIAERPARIADGVLQVLAGLPAAPRA